MLLSTHVSIHNMHMQTHVNVNSRLQRQEPESPIFHSHRKQAIQGLGGHRLTEGVKEEKGKKRKKGEKKEERRQRIFIMLLHGIQPRHQSKIFFSLIRTMTKLN